MPLCFQEVLDIARLLLVELGQHTDCEIEEKKSKLEQLKTVLEMWVTFHIKHTQTLSHKHTTSVIVLLFPAIIIHQQSSTGFIFQHFTTVQSFLLVLTIRQMITLICYLPLESLTFIIFIFSSLLCLSFFLPTLPSFFLSKRESSLNDTQYAPSPFSL